MRPAILLPALALAVALVAGCRGGGGDPLPLGESRASCGTCHAEQLDAFETSPHAQSSRSPVLAAMLPRVEEAWGLAARARCESCHAPQHAEGDDDVTCLSCHAAVGNRAERDGRLVIDPTPGLAGPFADADAGHAHGTRPSTFLATPSLCGTCHEVTGPELFVEPTLTEHLASPAFADGEHCADCHMPAIDDGPIAVGAERVRARRDHSFVGVDPPWGASPEDAAIAAERTRVLLASALDLRAHEADDGAIVIEVENIARGHDVPTGIAMLRDLGVDAVWIDERGDRSATERVLDLADRPMRGDLPVALPTDADRIEHHRLAPGEIRTLRLLPPPGATALHLTLVARAIRPDALQALSLESLTPQLPLHLLGDRIVAVTPRDH